MKPPLAIIEDQPAIRQALHTYLCAQPEFDCVAVAASVEELLAALDAGTTPPRLVVSDIGLPGGLSGIEGIAHVRARVPQAEVVLLTVYQEPERVVQAQIEKSVPENATADWFTLAYEPRWAIGTGRTPTLDEIAAIHAIARAKLQMMIGDAAMGVRILYGGSVIGDNAGAILSTENVDGALVGGASLTAAKFVPIIEAAARL